MARVKRGVTAHAKHKKVLKAAKGYYGRRKNTIRVAKQAVEKAQPIRLPRPQAAQAHVPRAVDPAPQRGGAPVRPELQPLHRRARQGRHRGRPQGALGPRDHRARGVRGDRRPGQVGARVDAFVMPGLVPGIHAFFAAADVDGRDSPAMTVGNVMIDRAYVQRMARYNRWQNENLYGVADTAVRRRAPQGARRLVRLDPQDAQSYLVGRPKLDEPLHRLAAAARSASRSPSRSIRTGKT